MVKVIPNILTIAGVDPSGGAGVFADIKAMSALGGYACGVVARIDCSKYTSSDGCLADSSRVCESSVRNLV